MSGSVPDTFLGLDGSRDAAFAVLPIPYDATTSYGVGARDGPRAIISASQQVELYDEGLRRSAPRGGVETLSPLEQDARGPKEMHARIYEAAGKIVRRGQFLISLGGEHSITSGLVRAVHSRFRKLSVLQIDAHADLRDSYQGSPYSHASVMRRIHEMGIPAVGVGIRNYCAAEARFIRAAEKPLFSARTCHDSPDWIERVVEKLTDDVYVTIDIDGFDPAYAPGTGTPEPGGLNWFQVTDLLAAVVQSRRVVAADVVEVRPVPGMLVTEFLAARLIHRLMAMLRL